MRPVICAVHDNRVAGHAQLIEFFQDRADVVVMVDHRVVIGTLPTAGLADAFRFGMGCESAWAVKFTHTNIGLPV